MSSHLESVTFRDINFTGATSFDWTKIGENGLARLSIIHCLGQTIILGNLPDVTASWSSLQSLDLVMPDTQMHNNPAALRTIEDALCSLPDSSLQHLRVEVPAAERLPNIQSITRHWKLESLVVAMTDSNGRWIAFHPNDLEVIERHCTLLQCLGLTFPPIDRNQCFIVSEMFWNFCSLADCYKNSFVSSISTLMIIGLEDSSPHASSPAWVRYCGHRNGGEEDYSPTLATVDPIFRTIECASGSEKILRTLAIGSHPGAYYCDKWVQEMSFFRWGSGSLPRRVAIGNVRLPKGVTDLFKEREIPAKVY
jgi:hypothetical protein